MKTKENKIKGIVKCGVVTLSFVATNVFGCSSISPDNVNVTKESTVKNTYLSAGTTRYFENYFRTTDLVKGDIELKQNDSDIIKTSYENEDNGIVDPMSVGDQQNAMKTIDENGDVLIVDPSYADIDDEEVTEPEMTPEEELELLRAENERLQQAVNKMEKTIDQYKMDTENLTKKLDKTKKELKKYKKKEVKHVAKLNTSDVRVLSGASPETLNKLLEGTWLEGHGQKFHDNEKKYGINALFSIGNAILETGWDGNNYLARNNNNIYGLNTSKKFDSYGHCIDHWFNLISKHYVGEGYISMSSIQGKYCPPNPSWDEQITAVTVRLRNKAGITIE